MSPGLERLPKSSPSVVLQTHWSRTDRLPGTGGVGAQAGQAALQPLPEQRRLDQDRLPAT